MWTRLLTDSCLLPPSRILPLFLVDNLFFLSDFRYCLAFPKAIVPMSSAKLQYLLTMLNFFLKSANWVVVQYFISVWVYFAFLW